MSKISFNDRTIQIPSDRIGIDMGESLTKFAYLENNELNLSSFSTQTSISAIKEFLNSKKEQFEIFNFTGGRSYELYIEYSKNFKTNLINEFHANSKGVEFLYNIQKKEELSKSLLVTIGTGTSIILKSEKVEHLGGSAIGGGFFMGLIKILFNLNDFQEAIRLAKRGNRYNLDLKVSDIYAPEDDRVDLLFREYTAASLGKINESFNTKSLKIEDFINSLICLIGENLGTIAIIIADNNNVTDIVFSGGFLKENKILKKILSLLCKVHKKKGIFLKNSEYSAGIGALLL